MDILEMRDAILLGLRVLGENGIDLLGHAGHGLGGIDLVVEMTLTVEVDKREGHVVVLLQSLAKRRLVVIGALGERFSGLIVNHRNLGRIELRVVRSSGGNMEESSSNSPNEKLVVNLELDHRVKRRLSLVEKSVQLLSLDGRPGESIEDESLCTSRLVKICLDHLTYDLISDELSLAHNRLDSLAELRSGCHLSTQHLTSGKMARLVLLTDNGCLGALSRSGRTDQNCSDSARNGLGNSSTPLFGDNGSLGLSGSVGSHSTTLK
ncbi:hypothetical protein PFISCL1PPCAC_23547, partial [Pristionchus fissidentatus]